MPASTLSQSKGPSTSQLVTTCSPNASGRAGAPSGLRAWETNWPTASAGQRPQRSGGVAPGKTPEPSPRQPTGFSDDGVKSGAPSAAVGVADGLSPPATLTGGAASLIKRGTGARL